MEAALDAASIHLLYKLTYFTVIKKYSPKDTRDLIDFTDFITL